MDVQTHKNEALSAILAANNAVELDAVRVAYLGKKGHITSLMKTLGAMAPEERKTAGQEINAAKNNVTEAVAKRKSELEEEALNARLLSEKEDVTLPARPQAKGHAHLISQTIDELLDILTPMGFSVEDGPQIEDDFHNFTALNIPKNHPARQMQDTFYIKNDVKEGEESKGDADAIAAYVLRTQTSSVQIRSMKNGKPPFKFVAPGRVYRSDYDMTHTPMFHQIEGLYIDKDIHMGHLKGCLQTLLQTFFEVDELPLRFRPSFFPFTEPSAEVDIGCARSRETVAIGKGDDWLEVLGCGMVHPNVLKNAGIDPEIYQGFAFGVGIERLAMLKYGAPDLREFFAGDNRWLNHYGFTLSQMA